MEKLRYVAQLVPRVRYLQFPSVPRLKILSFFGLFPQIFTIIVKAWVIAVHMEPIVVPTRLHHRTNGNFPPNITCLWVCPIRFVFINEFIVGKQSTASGEISQFILPCTIYIVCVCTCLVILYEFLAHLRINCINKFDLDAGLLEKYFFQRFRTRWMGIFPMPHLPGWYHQHQFFRRFPIGLEFP